MSRVTITVDANNLDEVTKKLERAASRASRMDPDDMIGVIPHLSSEFMLWLWWASDINGSLYNFEVFEEEEQSVSLDDDLDSIEIWLDDRITMRHADDTRVSNVMTGDTIASAPEAKVAIAGGKVVQEIRMGMRRDDREFVFGLKGGELALHGVRLPMVVSDGFEEVIYDRFALLTELETVLAKLFNDFARLRTSERWNGEIVPNIRSWLDDSYADE
jgi:hypothetical protein